MLNRTIAELQEENTKLRESLAEASQRARGVLQLWFYVTDPITDTCVGARHAEDEE
jgi:hypothetical protein